MPDKYQTLRDHAARFGGDKEINSFTPFADWGLVRELLSERDELLRQRDDCRRMMEKNCGPAGGIVEWDLTGATGPMGVPGIPASDIVYWAQKTPSSVFRGCPNCRTQIKYYQCPDDFIACQECHFVMSTIGMKPEDAITLWNNLPRRPKPPHVIDYAKCREADPELPALDNCPGCGAKTGLVEEGELNRTVVQCSGCGLRSGLSGCGFTSWEEARDDLRHLVTRWNDMPRGPSKRCWSCPSRYCYENCNGCHFYRGAR